MEPLTYTVDAIDRAALLRGDDATIQAFLTNPTARFVPVWKQRHPIAAEVAVIASRDAIDFSRTTTIFLGVVNHVPWFAVGLPDSETPPDLRPGAEFRPLNEVVSLLPGDQASLLAYARGMVLWHENHRHCGRCGALAQMTEAGHSRTCTNAACAHRTFPRTDPVVIMLVTRGDSCLLGRQAVWPSGVYSTIAGFVEPGETIEAAVRREVAEETGVSVGDVRYVTSQPWPFPASIMLGFRADALTTAIQRDDHELEDCQWFKRADVQQFGERDSGAPGFKLPGRHAIARLLIEQWLAE